MARPNIPVAIVSALLIAVVVGAIADAAKQPGKSDRQCRREATSLKWNPNDEADQWGFDQFMARCMYGTDAQTAVMIEHRMARRGDRLDRREQQVAQRRKPVTEIDRRALAQAEPRYRQYGVPTFDFCRDLGTVRAVRFGDEEDSANSFMRDCMRGRISR